MTEPIAEPIAKIAGVLAQIRRKPLTLFRPVNNSAYVLETSDLVLRSRPMANIEITLFGRLHVCYSDTPLCGLDISKVQQLLCYLLLYRTRPHAREVLAEMLWEEQAPNQAKKYLRKALWQLQSALTLPTQRAAIPLLQVDDEWIQFNSQAPYWLDIEEFEQIFTHFESIAGDRLQEPEVKLLQQAVQLYHSDLLEGWYHDWALYERERFRFMYLALLDKLMNYYETHQQYERGVSCATLILRLEPAHEHTHRRLMQFHLLAGDRAAALRQYEHCITALRRELDVAPSPQTEELYERIRCNERESQIAAPALDPTLQALYLRVQSLETILREAQQQVTQDRQLLEVLLKSRQL
jgi:DNA-binding SARP family transcriptional activator